MHCTLLSAATYEAQILCQTVEQRELADAEIRIHRQFEHPNLMPVLDWAFYDVTNQGTAAFMLLPYISGGTLRSFLDAVLPFGKRLSEHDILIMFQGVCRGVAQLHQAQLCHSDIKAGMAM
jgi:serine/threonine protein kinase